MMLSISLLDFIGESILAGGADPDEGTRLMDEIEQSAIYLEMPRNFKVVYLNKYIELSKRIEAKRAAANEPKATETKEEKPNGRRTKDAS